MTHAPAAALPAATRHDLELENIEGVMNHVRVSMRGIRLAASAGDAELIREICDYIQSLFESAGAMAASIMDSEDRM